MQEQELVRLTKPLQKRRSIKTLRAPLKKSSKELMITGHGSDYDYDRRTYTRTNSISLGSEYEGSEVSSYPNFD